MPPPAPRRAAGALNAPTSSTSRII
ncbi:MAG: hypothetical protein QOF44_5642, partial [Streptomyces sp.]|nr:hypothetical protein [Streptomyces sp.]